MASAQTVIPAEEPAAAACEERVVAERFYHPELDVLRFVAFFAVFAHHVVPMRTAGYVARGVPPVLASWLEAAARAGASGVDLFFALSSFLITELLLRERDATGAIDVRAFYTRRILRIWPLYYAFLAFTLWVVPRFLPIEHMSTGYAVAFGLFVANWACAIAGAPSSVATLLWSVSVEEQFYAAWPLLVRRLRGRFVGLAMVMLSIACTTRVWIAAHGSVHPAIWCNTLARLDPIAMGALACVALRCRSWNPSWHVRLAMIVGGVSLAVVGARFAPLFELTAPTVEVPVSALVAAATVYPTIALGCLLVLAGTYFQSGKPPALLRAAPLVYLGRISYGLYVVHIFTIELTRMLVKSHHMSMMWAPLTTLGLTIAMASASYTFLERPFLRLKERRFARVASRVGG
jgi:peptidoglycan/LPS O-acetylase OafA/YrhL